MTALTTQNAYLAATVQCIDHPEWGTKRFNFDAVNGFHSHGCGSNSAMLFECEFKFWEVVNFKTPAVADSFHFA